MPILGTDTTLTIDSNSITGVTITAPAQEVAEVDITTLASGAKEYMGGLTDGGELSFEVHYESALYTALNAIRGVTVPCVLTLPDSLAMTFDGFIKSLEVELNSEDATMIKGAVKVTGVVAVA